MLEHCLTGYRKSSIDCMEMIDASKIKDLFLLQKCFQFMMLITRHTVQCLPGYDLQSFCSLQWTKIWNPSVDYSSLAKNIFYSLNFSTFVFNGRTRLYYVTFRYGVYNFLGDIYIYRSIEHVKDSKIDKFSTNVNSGCHENAQNLPQK